MRIWVEQLQSQNTELAAGEEHHKAPPYIQKIRLQSSISIDCISRSPLSFTELDLKQNSYNPGDIALLFGAQSLATEPQFLAI